MKPVIPLATWRLVRTPPASGAWNMAVDEALLLSQSQPGSLPVLRLYAWQPACLSLGYAQPYQDADLENLEANGWHIVRRPTGGRAILHTDELTYSVIAPEDEPRLAGGVLESYQRLAAALLLALEKLGIAAQSKENATPIQPQPPHSQNETRINPVCFEAPSNYEIIAGGKKLIGSAQARKKEGVLQHGSLPLHGDLARIVQALRFASESERQQAAQRLLQRATTVEFLVQRQVSWQEAAQAFCDGFSSALNIQLQASDLSAVELLASERLVQEKYATAEWSRRV